MIFFDHFHSLLGLTRPYRFVIDWHALFAHKDKVNLTFLEWPFTLEEIKTATFALSANKALEPDGFRILFFQKHWNLIQNDPLKLCLDSYEDHADLDRLNWATIALFTKNNTPENISYFRPINLINSSGKIISKLLANRLSLVINKPADDSQSTFIKGKCITVNIVATEELIFNL